MDNGQLDASAASPLPDTDTIFESSRSESAPQTSHVIGERVQTLASQIYTELQKILSRMPEDDESVSGLMPLIVSVLESLDVALIENQQLQVELELCKDDNEQLVAAFEKEKNCKKKVDQKLLENEFQSEEEKQQLQVKIESMENVVRVLELKAKNASDHSSRLEEKESEMKHEYNKLHSRYTELLRSHCDLMERVKILIGTEDFGTSGPASLTGQTALRNFLTRKSDMEQALESEERQDTGVQRPVSPRTQRQNWIDSDMSLDTVDDTSLIEDVEDLPKDRLSDREPQSLTVNENFFGMEKEVENLISENNELLATKNALNIVKDDLIAKVDALESELTMSKDENQQLSAVKNKLKVRTSSLEEEVKKLREQLDDVKVKMEKMKEDDEEGIPMVQRKRFTRLEMARVLMERNQYKEKLIELQEAVRWTELIRASRSEGEKKSAIWKFFSNLFASPSSPTASSTPTRDASSGGSAGSPVGTVRYNSSSTITPALDAMRRRARAQHGADLGMLMDSDLSIERARAMRNVRAHVNRANGDRERVHAYGWSIAVNPVTTATPASNDAPKVDFQHTSVPVPTYCRPLSDDEVGLKIWCATAVDLSGGDPGASHSDPHEQTDSDPLGPAVNRNSSQSRSHPHNWRRKSSSKNQEEVGQESPAIVALETELKQALSENTEVPNEKTLSTFVWLCSVSQSRSKVTVINIRSNPSEVLDSFLVKTHLLCIASVPGAKSTDFSASADAVAADGRLGLERCTVTGEIRTGAIGRKESQSQPPVEESCEVRENDVPTLASSANQTLAKLNEYLAYTEPPPSPHKEESSLPTPSSPVYQPMSTLLPTMWIGGQNAVLYVHSSIAQWSHCIASLKLPDSILHISHIRGRVFVALANGRCCVFLRSETGEWDFRSYLVIDVSAIVASISVTSSIRCVEVAKNNVWMGYQNLVFIIDPRTLKTVTNFPLHPRKETQDLDIEPYVGKMLSPKAFSFIRITALKASGGRLWIGTANGVVLSIPCEASESSSKRLSLSTPPVIVTNSDADEKLAVSTFLPTCNSSAAQISFHGHRDAVKFFVCTKNLILSGGDGYIDFRVDEEDPSVCSLSKGDRSHLIVWEVMAAGAHS